MLYVFEKKQDGQFRHNGKVPKNYTDPVAMFVNEQIENKIKNETVKEDLKEAINLNHFCGD
jgi:protein-arginine kinase activator protein McsA